MQSRVGMDADSAGMKNPLMPRQQTAAMDLRIVDLPTQTGVYWTVIVMARGHATDEPVDPTRCLSPGMGQLDIWDCYSP